MFDTITRVANKTNGFTIMANEVFLRKDLSARAKGLFAYLMTLPSDWTIHRGELYTHFTEGRDAMDGAFKELLTLGYITQEIKKDKGKFSAIEYRVFESTVNGFPGAGFPGAVSPDTENPQLLSTNPKLSTNKQSKEPQPEFELQPEQRIASEAKPQTKLKITDPDHPDFIRHWGEFKHVRLTLNEGDRLTEKFGYETLEKAIKFLDEHIEEKRKDPAKSPTHNLTLQKWVFDAVAEKEAKQAKLKTGRW